jgi:hypothetical protein
VDDNEEIINLLKSTFETFYTVESAINGKEGLSSN